MRSGVTKSRRHSLWRAFDDEFAYERAGRCVALYGAGLIRYDRRLDIHRVYIGLDSLLGLLILRIFNVPDRLLGLALATHH